MLLLVKCLFTLKVDDVDVLSAENIEAVLIVNWSLSHHIWCHQANRAAPSCEFVVAWVENVELGQVACLRPSADQHDCLLKVAIFVYLLLGGVRVVWVFAQIASDVRQVKASDFAQIN